MHNTWELLEKELKYHGIRLINNKKCKLIEDEENTKSQGVIRTIRVLNGYVKEQKRMLLSLWNDVVKILQKNEENFEIIDDKMEKLFIFSIKDFLKYLQCFEESEKTIYYQTISIALTKDIKTFNKKQIYSIPDYKIAIDWITRNISRLLYICNLLSLASMGRNKVSQLEIKTATGIAGPWSRLELPMEERMFPFGFGLKQREKGKQKQNRYTKGLMNYNNDGRCGEGHFWRELRNEPFSWYDRGFEDPYPSRKQLSGRG